MDKLEIGAATALVGASAFAIHGVYTQHAGDLNDARSAPAGDAETRQRLSDADILTGALVVVVGGVLSVATKRPEPLVLAVAIFGVVAVYYHAVCESAPTGGVVSQPTGYANDDPTLDVGEGVTASYVPTVDDEHPTVY